METKDTKIKIIIKCTAKAAITIEATISLTLFMFVVVFLDRNFILNKQIFRDFEAQIIQHEIDHFSGILI